MEKLSHQWSMRELASRFAQINFPEYQREPNIWSRAAKQRLIDSIMRQFDISSICFYRDEDGSIDCIDGRQRLNAVWSFIGQNVDDEDNGFSYRRVNEIFNDEIILYGDLEDLSFGEIKSMESESEQANRFVEAFWNYNISIVELSGSRQPEEFNLQFTRLNVGAIINSGEKLHAMVGDLRDACFNNVGQHEFLEAISIPTRRYSREQVAAQLLAQLFAKHDLGSYTRTRHFDLQRLFKENTSLDEEHSALVERCLGLMTLLNDGFNQANVDVGILRNRAITVSTIILAYEQDVSSVEEAMLVARFMDAFLCRLRWQVRKALDVDDPYRYLIDFQRYVTQASVERPAVEGRAGMLRQQYSFWLETGGQIQGDLDYGGDPEQECRQAA